ncbi:hypothetical protein PInf_011784 [Phytophthora infestans]|nr:hypothetical protein PInf_029993 [Phytophthora infestans]KAI9994937.1 hypothetical protein PInf_011784 [Phytophthora infestans]
MAEARNIERLRVDDDVEVLYDFQAADPNYVEDRFEDYPEAVDRLESRRHSCRGGRWRVSHACRQYDEGSPLRSVSPKVLVELALTSTRRNASQRSMAEDRNIERLRVDDDVEVLYDFQAADPNYVEDRSEDYPEAFQPPLSEEMYAEEPFAEDDERQVGEDAPYPGTEGSFQELCLPSG